MWPSDHTKLINTLNRYPMLPTKLWTMIIHGIEKKEEKDETHKPTRHLAVPFFHNTAYIINIIQGAAARLIKQLPVLACALSKAPLGVIPTCKGSKPKP